MLNDNSQNQDLDFDSNKKDFLLSKDNFEKLMSVQRKVERETEFRPTFKKIINMIVEDYNFETIEKRMIENFKC